MKNVTLRVALATALVGCCALVGLTPANAITAVDYGLSFTTDTDPASSTQKFNPIFSGGPAGSSLATITAVGERGTVTTGTTTGQSLTATGLWDKSKGAGETGLGLKSDPAPSLSNSNHEIYSGTLIRIDVTQAILHGVGNFTFQMASTTQGEAWTVYGSNFSNNSYLQDLGYDHVTTNTASAQPLTLYDYYYFIYTGPAWNNGNSTCGDCNVLLAAFGGFTPGTDLSTPLPGALPLFATGLGALGLVAWRRKRKTAAAA